MLGRPSMFEHLDLILYPGLYGRGLRHLAACRPIEQAPDLRGRTALLYEDQFYVIVGVSSPAGHHSHVLEAQFVFLYIVLQQNLVAYGDRVSGMKYFVCGWVN